MMAMMIWGKIITKKGFTIPIFFPLIILYVLLLPIYIIAVAAYQILIFVGDSTSEARGYMKIFFELPNIFISLKGTIINIENRENNIKLRIS